MTSINFEKWSPIPNSEIDSLCLNKHVPVKVRVQWVIIRTILGFPENRDKGEAGIGFRFLVTKTGASKRQIIRAIKQLEAENQMRVEHKGGGRDRNIYHIDFNGASERHTYYDDDGKPYYKYLPKE